MRKKGLQENQGFIFFRDGNELWIMNLSCREVSREVTVVLRTFREGDLVVYRKEKWSVRPGPRAQGVIPAPNGDEYHYFVKKYWVVVGEKETNAVEVMTRRGKKHVLSCQDPNLRPASWWEKWLLRTRFPKEAN